MVHFQGALTTAHLRKHWTRFVKTWFNQAARKRRRLDNRQSKAAQLFPRPVSKLRPVVQCNTIKYNKRARLGRGFTLAEIKKAGLGPAFARSVGIAVDHRRQNKSVEVFQANVERLRQYKERLVLFPRAENATKADKPKARKGLINDATEEVLSKLQVTQNEERVVLGLPEPKRREKPTKITADLTGKNVYKVIRQEWSNQRNAGKREKRAKDEAEAAANKP